MNIVLFGAPGAGKGTQSSLLEKRLGYVQLSTGDLLRSEVKAQSELGKRTQSYMDRGDLVPDALVVEMVANRLRELAGKKFILDGFPRTPPQAVALGQMLSTMGLKLAKAVFLEVPQEELFERLVGRRVCSKCGAIFHIKSKPTRKEGICDVCEGAVVQRKDDDANVISTRLKNYESATVPLKEYYRNLGIYVGVPGNLDTEKVFEGLSEVLK